MSGRPLRHRTAAEYTPDTDPVAEGEDFEPRVPVTNEPIPVAEGKLPGQQLQNAKTGEGVPRVFRPAQDCQQVLDVCRLDKFEPAIFDERDVAARQLDLQPPAMVRGAEQDGLVAQIDPGLAVLQDLVGDIDCLRHFVSTVTR